MKVSALFVLIYTVTVETGVFCDAAVENTERANLTRNFDLCEDENKGDKVLLSRKRRYLAFPEGSAFASTLSVVKALLYEQTTPTNLVIEYDVIWPIPSSYNDNDNDDKDDKDDRNDDGGDDHHGDANHRIYTKYTKYTQNTNYKKRIGRPSQWRVYRRHKRDLYSAYEAALDSQGLPGKECVLRTICEAQSVLSPPGVSFIEDMLRIILSNFARSKNEMDEYDIAYKSKKDCDVNYACPFSILELLLSFDQNFTY